MGHHIQPSTVAALREAKNGTLRSTAKKLGFAESFAATLSDVLNEKHRNVSIATENRLRVALGLNPVSVVEVAPCPDCGSVHHVRCGKRNGTPEWKTEPKRRRPNKWYRPCLPPEMKEAVEASGKTPEELIRMALGMEE